MYINKDYKALHSAFMGLLFNGYVFVVYINKHYKTLHNAIIGLLLTEMLS